MMNTTQIAQTSDKIDVCELDNDRCLITIGDQRLVLTFDSVYELALKLAAHLSAEDYLEHTSLVSETLQ